MCRFVESLKDIMLNIFFENDKIRLCICIIVDNNICVYFLKICIRFIFAFES